MRDMSKRFDVANVSSGVANALAIHGSGFLSDQLCDIARTVRSREADLYALTAKNMREERVCGSIKLGYGNDVRAQFSHVEHGIIDGGLARADTYSLDPAFQGSDAPLQHR